MKDYFELFLVFMKIGAIAFGGGYAIIPIAERELVKKKGWIIMDELMDYYTIAQITPGVIAVNLSTFVGYKQKGALGGFFATLGFLIPGATYVIIAALFLSNLADIPAVQHAFTGIRIAVGTLILSTVIKLVKGIFKDRKALVIYIIVFVVSVFPGGIIPAFLKSPVLLVLVSGAVGLFIYRQKKPESSGGGTQPPASGSKPGVQS